MSPLKPLCLNFLCILLFLSQFSPQLLYHHSILSISYHFSGKTHFSFHLPSMAHKREYFFLLMLSMFATCIFPSLSDTDAQVLVRFKSSLSNADNALKNWGNESISICRWTGLLCKDQKLHGLRLEKMELSGNIDVDTLLELPSLRTFSVINNNFEGPMPVFKKLVSLRGLFLSNNKFSGEIPDDAFEGMKRLQRVFLAENGFSGHIPTSLAQLPRLLDVNLHGNSFGGNIPEFQQSDFRVLNLSNNQLEGPIPKGLSNRDPSSFAGNKALCGEPLSHNCSSESNPNPNEGKENKKHRNLITAIVVVTVVVLVTILALLVIRHHRRQSEKKTLLVENNAQAAQVQSQSSTISSAVVSSEATKSIDVVASVPKKGEDGDFKFVKEDREGFDLQDLLRASAEVLGSGSFGSTYKALVLNGPVVVVKRFKHMNNVGKQEFFEHMKRLGRLTHPNLLPFVAFYYGKEEKLLVYDFVENGSLASHLHGRRGSGLDWPTRLKIIKGVARGLGYLYREFPDQKLPHGHLKSSNVILNHSFEPLLTEYGLVPVVNKSHGQQFMASFKSPEVSRHHDTPTDKTDVWCLGILILELLTGKFPANYLRHGKGASEELAMWVKSIAGEEEEGWSGEVLDREIMGGGGGGGGGRSSGEGEMLKLLRIGVGCCEWDLERRWDWKEAVAKIEDLKERDVVEDAENSGVTDSDLYSL